MRDLNLSRGSSCVHSGRQHYSLGNGVTALSAELILSAPPDSLALTRWSTKDASDARGFLAILVQKSSGC